MKRKNQAIFQNIKHKGNESENMKEEQNCKRKDDKYDQFKRPNIQEVGIKETTENKK